MRIRICPKCKKAKLRNATNVSGWLAPSMYECLECGYIGYIYFEIDSDDFKELEKDEKKESNKKRVK
ncbi:MAG: hypothetical protein ACFFAN_19975 [Promethearchaeota archaeon]